MSSVKHFAGDKIRIAEKVFCQLHLAFFQGFPDISAADLPAVVSFLLYDSAS